MTPRSLFLVLAALVFLAPFTRAGEPPPLEKAEAEKILLGMDYDRVAVVAVVAGVHQRGIASLSCATVLGLGRRDGKEQQIVQSFFFDPALGWFYFEGDAGKMRIWTKDGYREATL